MSMHVCKYALIYFIEACDSEVTNARAHTQLILIYQVPRKLQLSQIMCVCMWVYLDIVSEQIRPQTLAKSCKTPALVHYGK